MIDRRTLVAGTALAGVVACLGFAARGSAKPDGETFEVSHTDAEWRRLLTPAQYGVLREAGTEAPGSSPLDHLFRKGLYSCAGCRSPLYSSQTKFESGTGWPSFWRPIDGAVRTTTDTSLLMVRTEVHCRRCGGHLGHVFNDGPEPTGLRYCMNGVAMTFTAA
ncbi:MAG TPA: peptide-methionine (R)-S-oxide reductase MsrB [Caulobacteraceae bacterium]|jgi:peptide-methionine (R)-S-oxide reductase|nr:peptide-methionine (R)-S-oxide reductase MsrB [Caulobacteraceae bacterium]